MLLEKETTKVPDALRAVKIIPIASHVSDVSTSAHTSARVCHSRAPPAFARVRENRVPGATQCSDDNRKDEERKDRGIGRYQHVRSCLAVVS